MMWQSAGRLTGWEFWLVSAWLSMSWICFVIANGKSSSNQSFALLLIKEYCRGYDVGYQ